MDVEKARILGLQIAETVWWMYGSKLGCRRAHRYLELSIAQHTAGQPVEIQSAIADSADARWKEMCYAAGITDAAAA